MESLGILTKFTTEKAETFQTDAMKRAINFLKQTFDEDIIPYSQGK